MGSAAVPTLLLEAGGAVRMSSSAAAALLARPQAELEGTPLSELVASPGSAVITAFLEGLARTGEPQRLAATLRGSGGTPMDADLVMRRLAESEGPPGAAPVLVTIRALDPGGARPDPGTHGALDLAPVEAASAVAEAALVCRQERIVHAGEGLSSLLGLGPRGLTGWSIKNLVDPEDLLRVVERLRDVESGEGAPAQFGFRLLRPGGPALEVAALARRIAWMGSPAVLLGLRDISAALRAARGAAAHLERLDAALAAADSGILILGEAGAGSPILFAGAPLRDLFGVDATRWTGRPFADLWEALRPAHARPEEQERSWAVLLQDAEAVRTETVSLTGAVERTLEHFSAPMRDESGRIIGRVCTFRDVTARLQAEGELLASREEACRAREELEVLHEELRLANEGLERRMVEMQRLNQGLRTLDEMRTNLLANVTHELQTPLVSVKGFTEMILKGHLGAVSPEQREGLTVALRNVDRLIAMTKGLLEFAREGASTPLRLSSFPLSSLVAEATALVAAPAEARGIRVSAALPPEGMTLRADREQALQVLVNLLSNAVKYNRDGGEVVVEAARGRRGAATIHVRDTGPGIPREDLDAIFERFRRGSSAEGQPPGTGLGLSITRDILRRHGCTIRAESEPGKGSVFTFTLPLERGRRPEPAAAAEGQPSARRAPGSRRAVEEA